LSGKERKASTKIPNQGEGENKGDQESETLLISKESRKEEERE